MRYVSDGKSFESEKDYVTFLETNVKKPYALAPGPSNVSGFLHSIDIFDANGTMHVMSPIKNDGQNRDNTWLSRIFLNFCNLDLSKWTYEKGCDLGVILALKLE